jgi:alpha-beta hydrolase superfamily lysophospholipase
MREDVWRRESQVELSDAGPRHRRAWIPHEPRGALVLVHGYAEHTGRYDEMAMHFAGRGWAVHAYDQAGHGRSPGPRGHVDRFGRLVDELDRFVELVSEDHRGLPLVLLGHSMGGLVAAATTAFRRPAIDRLVLSGALLELGSDDSGTWQRVGLVLARMLSPLMPRFALSTGLDVEGLSRDPEVVRRYLDDPLVKDRMSVRFAAGMNAMIQATRAAADRIETPALILHGGADPISPVSGSRALHAGLRDDVAERSRLEIYPELRHEIFQEPERERVWADVLAWLEDIAASEASEPRGAVHG